MTSPVGSARSLSQGAVVAGFVVVGALLVAATLAVLGALDASRDLKDARRDVATAGGSGRARELVTAVQDERNFATAYLLGFENALVMPVASVDEGAAATDEALAAFRSEVERTGGDLADAYGPVLSDLDASLPGLRQSVAEASGPRDLSRTGVSDPIYAGYTDLVGALLTADDAVTLAIDDPDLRRGAHLLNLAATQPMVVGRLVRGLMIAGVGPDNGLLDTPDEITPVARDYAALQANEAELASLAVGEFEPATSELADSGSFAELSSVIETSLEGQVVPIATLLVIAGEDGELLERYAGFEDAVLTRFEARAEDLESEAETRRLIWFGLAALAVVGLVVTLVVLVR
jgi:Nitrate and nitrite sensing